MVPSVDEGKGKSLDTRGVPVVIMDRLAKGAFNVEPDEVTVQNRAGALMAVEHLLGHGHKRIACVGYNKTQSTIQERIKGYKYAMRSAGLAAEVHDAVRTVGDTIRIVREWVGSKSRPTAVFSLNGPSTLHVLAALKEVGLEIPDSMGLAAFDDFEAAALARSPITTVRQPVADIGLKAANLLFARMDRMPLPGDGPVKVQLPVELIVRESCGCAPVN